MSGTSTPAAPRRFEERNVPPALQGLVSRVLRIGVVVFGILILAGALLEALTAHGSLLAESAPSSLSGFSAILARGGPAALVLVGVIVLLATPLCRVAISTALFASAGDRAFAMITLFVLTVLAVTIVVGVLH